MKQVMKKQETQIVETHEIENTQNAFRAQSAQIRKDLNDPEKSIFWTAPAGVTSEMRVFEALLRNQEFTLNNVKSKYLVLDFKGTVGGNVKIVSFPSFVLRTAEAAVSILESHDANILNMEPIGEDVAFANRPWVGLKTPFVIKALFANIKGTSRIVHVSEVIE